MRIRSLPIRALAFAVCALLMQTGTVRAMDALVTRVVDGDSFEIRGQNGDGAIRLYGIDSPEYGQNGWHEARAYVRGLIQDKSVHLQPVDKDRYGRIVALAWYRGQMINELMVRNGMAWMYPHYCTSQPFCDRLAELEKMARREHLGIWRQRQPTPPWVWKRRH